MPSNRHERDARHDAHDRGHPSGVRLAEEHPAAHRRDEEIAALFDRDDVHLGDQGERGVEAAHVERLHRGDAEQQQQQRGARAQQRHGAPRRATGSGGLGLACRVVVVATPVAAGLACWRRLLQRRRERGGAEGRPESGE